MFKKLESLWSDPFLNPIHSHLMSSDFVKQACRLAEQYIKIGYDWVLSRMFISLNREQLVVAASLLNWDKSRLSLRAMEL